MNMHGLLVLIVFAICECSGGSTCNDSCESNSTDSWPVLKILPAEGQLAMVGYRSAIEVIVLNHTQAVHLTLLIETRRTDVVRLLAGSNDTNGTVLLDLADGASGIHTGRLDMFGLAPGVAELHMSILTANLTPLDTIPMTSYYVKVTHEVYLVDDVFVYVLASAEMLTLMMLGFRVRKEAVKEVLTKPCALIGGIITQVVVMPLVALGSALSLSLDREDMLCFLIIGCCPASILSPMFSVLQHANVELAIVLLLLQTVLAFGIVPTWMITFNHFLSNTYEKISFPFYQLAGTLGALVWPVIVGALVQRCSPKSLPILDKTIHPTCLLLTLTASTVSAYRFWKLWPLVTDELLVGTALITLIGCFIGALAVSVFRCKMSSVKSVAIVTGLQNTVLAALIVQTSYPITRSSAMHTAIVCLEFTSLCLMYAMYLLHLVTWAVLPTYRSLHDSIGITGIYRSIAEKIVKRMIKSGEISLRKDQRGIPSPCPSNHTPTKETVSSDSSDTRSNNSRDTLPLNSSRLADNHGFKNNGLKQKLFSTSFESMKYLSQKPLFLANHGSISSGTSIMSYFGTFIEHPGDSTNESTDFESSEICLALDNHQSDSDSLSIDYRMLEANDVSRNRNFFLGDFNGQRAKRPESSIDIAGILPPNSNVISNTLPSRNGRKDMLHRSSISDMSKIINENATSGKRDIVSRDRGSSTVTSGFVSGLGMDDDTSEDNRQRINRRMPINHVHDERELHQGVYEMSDATTGDVRLPDPAVDSETAFNDAASDKTAILPVTK